MYTKNTTYYVYFGQNDSVVYLPLVRQGDESDMWEDLAVYDREHDTGWCDTIGVEDVLDVALPHEGAFAGSATRADDTRVAIPHASKVRYVECDGCKVHCYGVRYGEIDDKCAWGKKQCHWGEITKSRFERKTNVKLE